MKSGATKVGHLKHGSLRLEQNEQTRRGLSKASKTRYTLKKLAHVTLSWSKNKVYEA